MPSNQRCDCHKAKPIPVNEHHRLFIHTQSDLYSIIRIIPLNENDSSVWSWAGQEILSKSEVRSSYEKGSDGMSDLDSDKKIIPFVAN